MMFNLVDLLEINNGEIKLSVEKFSKNFPEEYSKLVKDALRQKDPIQSATVKLDVTHGWFDADNEEFDNKNDLSKYYRVEDEELHIGFEYYRQEPYTGEMDLCEWDESSSYRHYNKYSEEFYAKYLDTEDIESLGFEHIGAMWFNKKNIRIRKWKNTEIDIWKDDNLVFRGNIKNKSELKVILKWIHEE